MSTAKAIVGVIAIGMTFGGYVPYIRDTIRGKTRPHIYSWLLWGSVSLIAFALQLTAGGGIGSFVTLAAAVVCLFICVLGVRNGRSDIHMIDSVFLALAVVALVLWLAADQAVLSVILLSTVEMLGFLPTVRKSWNQPHTETLSSYITNTARFVLALFALAQYSIVTMLYPATWLLANGAFAVLLLARRRALLSAEAQPA